MIEENRERVIDCIDVVNDFVGDFLASIGCIVGSSKALDDGAIDGNSKASLDKMAFSHLVLTLYKWVEFYDNYRDLIPDDLTSDSKKTIKNIRKLGIVKFRNTCVGHIFKRGERKPLKSSEIMKEIETITEGDFPAFLRWIHNPTNPDEFSIMNLSVSIREYLLEKHQVDKAEVLGR